LRGEIRVLKRLLALPVAAQAPVTDPAEWAAS
jgi:hypothetical protein